MRKLKCLMMLLLLFVAVIGGGNSLKANTLGDGGTISGTVKSAENGEPIVGANVIVKKTGTGDLTDTDGKFKVKAAAGDTLVISFLGMKPIEKIAADNMVVELTENSEMLDAVMVVAYGKTTKSQFTGSASVMTSDEISKIQTSDVSNSLSGRVAGVQGLSGNGQPGTGSSIRIRGVGSMNASNAPLYVVDGVPYDTSISSISNSDIAEITVLKDAAANALYGARGANGVIIITTKRGKGKDGKISVDMKWGRNGRAIPSYNVMTDPGMYYETFYRAMYNSQVAKGAAVAHAYANKNLLDGANGGLNYLVYTLPQGERLVGTNFKLNPNAKLGYSDGNYTYRPDDWYKELFKADNLRREYNISASGASDKLTYFASVNSLKDTGIVPNSDFNRLSTRANVDYKVKKWLKVGTNMSFVSVKTMYPGEQTKSTSSANLFYISSAIAPIYPLYVRDANGNILIDSNNNTVYDYGDGKVFPKTRPFMNKANPAGNLSLNRDYNLVEYFVGKWYAEIDFMEGLKGTINYGITSANDKNHSTLNPYYGQYAETGGIASVAQSRFFSETQQYLLSYVKKINEHSIDLLAGVESYNFKSSSLYASKKKLFQPYVAEVNNAIVEPTGSSSSYSYATLGILTRALYNYQSKYFGSFSYRRDGSSAFSPKHRWGNFWSFGTAWNLTKEDFMQEYDYIDLLKLKASYGAQGNDKLLYTNGTINYFPYQDQYVVSESNGNFATARSYKGNEDLTWETSHNFNIGADFGLFGERLNGSIEYFNKRTSDMLYYKPVSSSLGYSELPVNIGSVQNSGLEIDLNGMIIKTNALKWEVYANATIFKNKIIKLSPDLKDGKWIDGSRMYREGESLYNLYLRQYAGVDKKDGSSLWYKDKKNKKGEVVGQEKVKDWTTATKYETGDILPKVYGGFGTSVDYKGFDFSVALSYQLGGRLVDYGYANAMHGGGSSVAGQNWHIDILDAWTPENPDTNIPRINSLDNYTNAMSDRFLITSNYLSLQNITFGYSLPSRLLDKVKISKLRIYVVADNVGLLSARRGLDPRQSYVSSVATRYTPIRSISGGINLSF